MPDRVIMNINKWGLRDGKKGQLRFCDHHNKPFDWNLEDEEIPIDDNAADPVPEAPFLDIPDKIPGVALENKMPI